MKIAVVGSRGISAVDIGAYLPENVTEIVSGGAKGVDRLAADYARKNGIPLTEFLPDYKRYGRGAPLKRNEQIADYADMVIAFWDRSSRGTAYTIDLFRKRGKEIRIVDIPSGTAPAFPENP